MKKICLENVKVIANEFRNLKKSYFIVFSNKGECIASKPILIPKGDIQCFSLQYLMINRLSFEVKLQLATPGFGFSRNIEEITCEIFSI